MGKRTEHTRGTFSWVDLATTDIDGAKAFYGGLFGWEFDEQPTDMGPYALCKLGGSTACAIYGQQAEQREQGVPPHWDSYVTVEVADAAAAKAKELGANVMMEAFDVFDAGRMAVLQDPTGAVILVWQPKQSIGAEVVNEPGALTWNELHTPDPDTAVAFYTALFGWTTETMESEGNPPYHVIRNGERSNGGIFSPETGQPPSWFPYFATESLEGDISKTTAAGGSSLTGVIPMPQGRIAMLTDPQGAVFALWEGQLED